ncbi:hypothetical protein HPB47_001372 [Ixodes persulcatus]|uniref:Uncharacterized protein n=1 Tax=Ixodes persulcatus TaxID=34615 RepID=A0AC60PPE6_IXOPE|nr:hypothetical protein HPB47_001372 [Ixodes persulcatus]
MTRGSIRRGSEREEETRVRGTSEAWQFDDGPIECPRGASHVALLSFVVCHSNFSILAAASRGVLPGFHNRTRVSLSSRRLNLWLPKLPWTATAESDLQQSRRLPHTPPLLGHCHDRDRRQHSARMTSPGRNRETEVLDADHIGANIFAHRYRVRELPPNYDRPRRHSSLSLTSPSPGEHLATEAATTCARAVRSQRTDMSASQSAAKAGTSNSPPPPATNSPPQQLPTSPANTSILITPTRVECMVEGDEIDPDILREPGWKTIRSRIAATTATSATTTPAADPTKPQQKRRQLRKKPTTPPEDPLPPDDFKVVIRPQGGLDLSKTNAAQLADCIFHQTKIKDFAQDQVRINTRSNFIVVSTPDERRAQQYMNLNAITWNATHYPVQSHIPPPSTTTSGAIFQIPAEDSEPLIMESLTRHNPTITVIDARRIKDTGIVQVLFLGPHVPFWVRYRAVILRCYPYKRKTEACMACWSAGHRRDVCPKPSPKPHCTICGTLGPTPNHPCQPHCILCGQDHLTGAAGCPPPIPPPPPPPSTWQDEMRQMRQEMQQLRNTITLLRADNERLQAENRLLKQQLQTSHNPPAPTPDQLTTSPPSKKRALFPNTDPHPTSSGNAEIATLRAEIETAFDNHRQHTSAQISAIQESVHSLHQEVLQWMHLAAPTTTPLPITPENDPDL